MGYIVNIFFFLYVFPAVKRTLPRYYLNDINYKVLHDVDIHQHWNFRLDEWPIYTKQTPAKGTSIKDVRCLGR